MSNPGLGRGPQAAELAAAIQDTAGFVLAGGMSSRMGTDKALVQLGGKPLIAHALEIFRDAGMTAQIAGGRADLAAYAPMVEDRRTGLGPLGGMVSVLAASAAGWAVFMPLDLPLLPASLLIWLIHHAKITGRMVTMAAVNGYSQTFPAVLHRSILPILEKELEAGRRGCFSAFKTAADRVGEPATGIAVESLLQCGQVSDPRGMPASRWFLNVNTRESLRRAEVLSAREVRVS